jgi:uncharacterized membrane protein
MKNVPLDSDISALLWIRDNAPVGSVVLAPLEQGHLTTYYSGMKNVFDSNFLLVRDPEKILWDVKTIYTSKYTVEVITLLDKYDVDYILLSEKAQSIYHIDELPYSMDNCFDRVLNGKTRVYESVCSIKESQRNG